LVAHNRQDRSILLCPAEGEAVGGAEASPSSNRACSREFPFSMLASSTAYDDVDLAG
jgi:hypothetical protein